MTLYRDLFKTSTVKQNHIQDMSGRARLVKISLASNNYKRQIILRLILADANEKIVVHEFTNSVTERQQFKQTGHATYSHSLSPLDN